MNRSTFRVVKNDAGEYLTWIGNRDDADMNWRPKGDQSARFFTSKDAWEQARTRGGKVYVVRATRTTVQKEREQIVALLQRLSADSENADVRQALDDASWRVLRLEHRHKERAR